LKRSELLNNIASEAAARRFLASHPDVFIEYYSGLRLKDYHRKVIYAMQLHKRIVILLPAGHGKSTLTKWFIIYNLAINPNVRIILVMKTDNEVSSYARAIKRELISNPRLIHDWGPFKPEGNDIVWSNDAIEVYHRQIREPQPTVEFASSKSIDQVLGHRCDIYICDDIVTPKVVSTEEQRRKFEEIFNEGVDRNPQYIWDIEPQTGEFINKPPEVYWPRPQDFEPGLAPVYEKGILLGTVFHPQDLFHLKGRSPLNLRPGKIYRGNDPKWKVLYYDCWEHDEDNNVTDRPLWPERWTAEELKLTEASIGTLDFNRRYRNIAIDEGELVFKPAWIVGDPPDYPGCLDESRSFGELPDIPSPFIVLGLDPSSGRTSRASSFSSYVVLAASKAEQPPAKRYVIDIRRGQFGFDDILNTLYELYRRYGCHLAVVEQNASQRWLLDNHRVKSWQADEGFRIQGHETQSGTKLDPVMGVASMQSLFRDGKVSIPWATPSDREKARELVEQLKLYPTGVTDYVMAFWFANIGIGDTVRRYRSWARGGHTYITLPSARVYSREPLPKGGAP
jgi:hypothetical protein